MHPHITTTSRFLNLSRNLPQLQKLLQKIPKSTPSKSTPTTRSATWTSVTSPTTHQLPRHHPSVRGNSKKNRKLRGRFSQSSQITQGILQESFSPIDSLRTQAFPPPITALPPSPPRLSSNYQLHKYKYLQ